MIWTFIDMKAVILESKEWTTTENKISQKFYVFIKAMFNIECCVRVFSSNNRLSALFRYEFNWIECQRRVNSFQIHKAPNFVLNLIFSISHKKKTDVHN